MEHIENRTRENLMTAFAGESQSGTKYDLYAEIAREEGHAPLSEILSDLARQERGHARLWLNALGELGGTVDNLTNATENENYDYDQMYATFAKEAEEDGLPDLAAKFRAVAEIERRHQELLSEILRQMEEHCGIFAAENTDAFFCHRCGYRTVKPQGNGCPLCGAGKECHPQ